ncbi:MAG TPA: response regulator [Thermoanaerobaculia bacterium]|nr:response regulator [Thermoanaerobaculia bacterium]
MATKILLADDSLTIQKVVELTFSDSGYDLVCVSNGLRALEKVREDRPDLILADAVMPEKNGYEVCEAIKGDPSTARIPVVLLSGTFEPFDRERAERIGADAIVSKPFDSQQLLAQVDALLDRVRTNVGSRDFRSGSMLTTTAIAIPPLPGPSSAPKSSREEAPFDVGFSSEDFTASVRLPPNRKAIDPFEEEYGRGDVDSAIAAFEKAHPRSGSELDGSATPGLAEQPLRRGEPAHDPQWLREEPEKSASPPPFGSEAAAAPQRRPFSPDSSSEASTVAISRAAFPPRPEAEAPPRDLPFPETDRRSAAERMDDEETDPGSSARSGRGDYAYASGPSEATAHESIAMGTSAQDDEPIPYASGEAPRESFASEEEDVSPAPREAEPPAPPASSTSAAAPPTEMPAQRPPIPLLTQILSDVRGAGDMTDEQMDRLADRIVEKLSERVIREIAWEVIPDMAEIVIKQRIKELESGIE